ncbi:MAG: hypothetical protein NVSMB42_08530 [Herpetosiphon sp.]
MSFDLNAEAVARARIEEFQRQAARDHLASEARKARKSPSAASRSQRLTTLLKHFRSLLLRRKRPATAE